MHIFIIISFDLHPFFTLTLYLSTELKSITTAISSFNPLKKGVWLIWKLKFVALFNCIGLYYKHVWYVVHPIYTNK